VARTSPHSGVHRHERRGTGAPISQRAQLRSRGVWQHLTDSRFRDRLVARRRISKAQRPQPSEVLQNLLPDGHRPRAAATNFKPILHDGRRPRAAAPRLQTQLSRTPRGRLADVSQSSRGRLGACRGLVGTDSCGSGPASVAPKGQACTKRPTERPESSAPLQCGRARSRDLEASSRE